MDLINEYRPAKICFSFPNNNTSVNTAVSVAPALQAIYDFKSGTLWSYKDFYAFHLILQNRNTYITMGKSFDIYYDFFDENDNQLFRYTHTIAEDEKIESIIDDFYTTTDLSGTSRIQITSSLSGTESLDVVEPSPSPTSTTISTTAPAEAGSSSTTRGQIKIATRTQIQINQIQILME